MLSFQKTHQFPFEFQFMSLCLLVIVITISNSVPSFFFFNLCCVLFKVVVGITRIAESESLLFCLVMALEIV